MQTTYYIYKENTLIDLITAHTPTSTESSNFLVFR